MSHPDKQQLLEEFSAFLEHSEFDTSELAQTPDLHSLLTEMAALTMHVKGESRHLKTMLDQFSDALEILKANNKILSEELHRTQQQLLDQKHTIQYETQRKMLLQLLEVYDRLAAGAALLVKYQPVNSFLSHSKKQDKRFINSISEGQNMSIKRLEQLLQSYHVHAIKTVGKTLDPNSMTAVAIVHKKHLPQGHVVEEIRTGFFFEDSVLRLAEVKVNKTPESPTTYIP